jgi:hypothetical protein
MHIMTTCMTCAWAEIGTNAEAPQIKFNRLELRDDGLYSFTCEEGHKNLIGLQQQSFEVLPELAVNAILDGYYREAVASFASGMERFFEFYVRIIAHANTIPAEEFDNAWKSAAKYSERQLGAYIVAHLICEHRGPMLLSNAKTEFRNDVIHRGKVPTRDQAIAFGNAVFEVVLPTLAALKAKYAGTIQDDVMAHVKRVASQAKGGPFKYSSMCIGTTVSLASAEPNKETAVEQAIARVETMRAKFAESGTLR